MKEVGSQSFPAGEKVFITSTVAASDSIPFTAEKGKSYFVKGEREFCLSAPFGCVSLNLVPEEKALKEIQKCSKVEE
jgi:hypothetical protein